MKILFCILLFFWTGSVFAQNDYTEIDQYAYEAPALRNPNMLPRLVRHLVHSYKTDKDKARVILAWIVHNIDYDEYKANAILDELDTTKKKNKELFISNNDILETRIGVCEDIAKLYQKMGEMAGLNVALIYGKTKDEHTPLADFEQGLNHTWNAVQIGREWEYVDPTWAMGGDHPNRLGDISKKREYEKVIHRREKRGSDAKLPRTGRVINNQWFLTDKEEMIKTHFPFDPKWQLQKEKITPAEFLNLTDQQPYQDAREKSHTKRRGKVR